MSTLVEDPWPEEIRCRLCEKVLAEHVIPFLGDIEVGSLIEADFGDIKMTGVYCDPRGD